MCLANSINQQMHDKIEDIENSPDQNFLKIIDDDLILFDGNCQYVEPSNLKLQNDSNSNLNILYANIHSVPSKLNDLKTLLENFQNNNITIDIILLCETFINDINKSQCKLQGYQLIEEHRISKTKGGVAIYISDRIHYKERNDLKLFKEGFFESCFVEIKNSTKDILVGVIYRVPGTSEKDFLEEYETLVTLLNSENKEIIIGTDQNLDYLKINQHPNTAKFLELNLSSNLMPTVVKPTRVTHTTATLIDNIYLSSRLCTTSTSRIIVSDISDHFPCLVSIAKFKHQNRNPLIFKTRKVTQESIDEMYVRLNAVNWERLDVLNANDGYDYIVSNVEKILDDVSPEKTIVIPFCKIIREPWMTEGLMKSSAEKDKLYRKCAGLDKNHDKYKKFIIYRNKFNSLKRTARQRYYSAKIQEFRNNSQRLWKILNSMIGKHNDKSLPNDSFNIDGNIVSDPAIISNSFCNFYSTNSKKLADSIPNSNKNFKDFLGDPVRESIFFQPTDENEIEKCIKSLPNKKSSGYDGISNIIIKGLSGVLKEPLCKVFNNSMTDGIFPDSMKIAEINPVYKSKEKNIQSNYRPISLLPVISKILEKIIYKRVYSFLMKHNVLYTSQYGFRTEHSTIHAVTELIGNILKGFEENKITLGLFLDLSKAFDTLKHSTLLEKLEHYGIRGTPLNWFESYLNNRKQYVNYNGVKSEFNRVTLEYGVPQGSVLGPLLYLIFCNDIYKCIKYCKTILFADDTTIYATHKNLRQLLFQMKSDFASVIDWFRANKLSINLAKTNYIIFRPKNMIIQDPDEISLSFGNVEIKRVEFTKFLGIFIDSNLNWTSHVEHVCSQVSKSLYILRSVKKCLPKWVLKMLYYAYYYSHITYGLTLWGPMCTKAQSNRITLSQKKAIRSVDNAQYNAHTGPLFKKFNILTFADCVSLELAKLVYQASKSMFPMPVLNLFERAGDYHQYNTRNRNNPIISTHSSTIFNKSFLCKAPSLWATLNNDLKNSKSLHSFANRFRKGRTSEYT